MEFQHKPHDICDISSPFGERWIPEHGFHYGNDIRAKVHGVAGDNIYDVMDGIVKYTGFDADGYGNYIIIEHTDSCTVYAHLLKSIIKVGSNVKAGQIIGYMGSTGHSTGVHCHFELRKCKYISATAFVNGRTKYCVDPLPYIKGVDKVDNQLTKVEAYNLVQKTTGFSDSTMFYLDCYKYGDTLFLKLGDGIQKSSISNAIITDKNIAIGILKNKADLSDSTIDFLDLYKYGDSLICKLAQAID